MSEEEFARRFFEGDLSDLPTPRKERSGRSPVLMVGVMVASAILMWMFWEDTAYWMQPAAPTDFGDTARFREAHRADPARRPEGLAHNQYVRISGLTAFRTESESAHQAFLKMTYVPVYVHLRGEEPSKPSDTLVHLTVSGRLVDMARTSRYASVQRFYAEQFGVPTRDAFMLVAEEKPQDLWWTVPLQALFALFILVNGGLLIRTLRS